MLQTAERQVEVLTGFDAAGNPVTVPFDDTATVVAAARASSASETSTAVANASDNPPAVKSPASKLLLQSPSKLLPGKKRHRNPMIPTMNRR